MKGDLNQEGDDMQANDEEGVIPLPSVAKFDGQVASKAIDGEEEDVGAKYLCPNLFSPHACRTDAYEKGHAETCPDEPLTEFVCAWWAQFVVAIGVGECFS